MKRTTAEEKVPNIPTLPEPTEEEWKRIKRRRKQGLPVFPPSSEREMQEMYLDLEQKQDDAQMEQFSSQSCQNLQAGSQFMIQKWQNSIKEELHTETLTKEKEQQWIEYFDSSVEAHYYYNPSTGEATWIKPSSNNIRKLGK